MIFKVGKNNVEFREGFKPKSFSKFSKTHSHLGSEEELRKIFDKLNGNTIRAVKKVKKADRKVD